MLPRAQPWPWAIGGPPSHPRPQRASGPLRRGQPRALPPFPLSPHGRARLLALTSPLPLSLHRGARSSASPPFFLVEPGARDVIQRHHSPPPAFKLRLMEAINRPSSRLDARLNRPSVRPLSAPAHPIKLTAEPLLFPLSVLEPNRAQSVPKFSVFGAQWTLRTCAERSPGDPTAVGALSPCFFFTFG